MLARPRRSARLDYHTGLVFVAYLQGTTHVVARGGRYDGVGEAFKLRQCLRTARNRLRLWDLRALTEVTQPAECRSEFPRPGTGRPPSRQFRCKSFCPRNLESEHAT